MQLSKRSGPRLHRCIANISEGTPPAVPLNVIGQRTLAKFAQHRRERRANVLLFPFDRGWTRAERRRGIGRFQRVAT